MSKMINEIKQTKVKYIDMSEELAKRKNILALKYHTFRALQDSCFYDVVNYDSYSWMYYYWAEKSDRAWKRLEELENEPRIKAVPLPEAQYVRG